MAPSPFREAILLSPKLGLYTLLHSDQGTPMRILFCLAAALIGAPASAEPLCDQLKRVAQTALETPPFETLAGAALPGAFSPKVLGKLILPGFKECQVRARESEYLCSTDSTLNTATITGTLKDLNEKIFACFGIVGHPGYMNAAARHTEFDFIREERLRARINTRAVEDNMVVLSYWVAP
jgi:hypothetical protein